MISSSDTLTDMDLVSFSNLIRRGDDVIFYVGWQQDGTLQNDFSLPSLWALDQGCQVGDFIAKFSKTGEIWTLYG